jgi:hypothetical protein
MQPTLPTHPKRHSLMHQTPIFFSQNAPLA